MVDKKVTAPAAVKPKEDVDPRKVMKKVRVYRLNVDEQNTDLIITVHDLGDPKNGKAAFYPGQEVTLTQTQINILKDSVVRHQISIEHGSGIYEASNPLTAAKAQFRGFNAYMDRHTGMVVVVKTEPNYSVEYV